MAVCGAYVVAPYPDGRKFIRFLVRFYPMQKKIAIFPGIRVGAYCIRPTNDHDSDRMSGKTGVFGVRFYPEKKKIVIFPGIRVGAYCIRPTGGHVSGRVNEKMGVLRFVFIRGIENRMRIGPRFVRGMDFFEGIRFIRPLAWPFVGRMQYAPTWMMKILSIFSFIRSLVWLLVGRIQYAPTLTDENSSGFGFVFSRCRRKSPFFRVSV